MLVTNSSLRDLCIMSTTVVSIDQISLRTFQPFLDEKNRKATRPAKKLCQHAIWLTLILIYRLIRFFNDHGAFNLHLLEFTFDYQFYSRKTNLVESTFQNPVGLFAFMSFHSHFKLFWYCVLLKIIGIFCPYLFWDTAKW